MNLRCSKISLISTVFLVLACNPAKEVAAKCEADVETLAQANGISDECRTAILAVLPQVQSSIASRTIVLGKTKSSNDVSVHFVSTDVTGASLDTSDLMQVSAVTTAEGQESAVDAARIEVSSLDLSAENVLSLGLVTDYSSSMREADIELAREIHTDLFSILGSKFATQVSIFSSLIARKLEFSTDLTQITDAIAFDREFTRDSTALFDAMGQELDPLSERTSAVKIQLVTTDGRENASKLYTKDTLRSKIKVSGVTPVLIGSLFADISVMKELVGNEGVFIYGPTMQAAKKEFLILRDTLKKAYTVTVKQVDAAAESLTISVKGQKATLSLK